MAKRKHPWNRGRKFKRHHGKGRSGYHYVSNPHKKRHHRRHHRRNPELSMLWKIGLGALAGIGVSVAGAMAIDAIWPTGSSQAKTWLLVGGAAAAAIFLGPASPALAAGIATGLVLVPGQQLIAGMLSSSSGPSASNPQVSAGSGAGLLQGMGLLQGGTGFANAGVPLVYDDAQAIADQHFLRSRGLID